jgi:MioC protein
MSSVSIFVGSVLGATEYVAEALAAMLKEANIDVDLQFQPDLHQATSDRWIICTSTHGAGDLPDNIQPFAQQLANADLSNKRVLLIGLGDSSYDTFCGAAMTIESVLLNSKATLLAPALHIDVLHHPIPEDAAITWFKGHMSLLVD